MTIMWGTTGRRVLLATIGTLLLASASAATAAARSVTFGASLKQAPNVSFDCSVIPCAYGTPTIEGRSTGGLDAPGTGTISQVKLRVGASTGRMQIVILRTLIDPNNFNSQCCIMVARSSIFTPVRNGITTEKVKLPVKVGALSTNLDALDEVGLQILEDHVAIPVINETSLPIQDQPVVDYNEPAFTKLGASQLAADPAGYLLDMQAVWSP
jgi:hypothetical protein